MVRIRQDHEHPVSTQELNDTLARVTYENEIKSCHTRGEDINAPNEQMDRFASQASALEIPEWSPDQLRRLANHDKERITRLLSARRKALEAYQRLHQPTSGDAEDPSKSFDYLLACTDIWISTDDHSPAFQQHEHNRKGSTVRGAASRFKGQKPNEDEEALEENLDHREQATRLQTTPPYLWGELRAYQIQGVNWLVRLFDKGINGILADEMGLGKTFQTIAFVSFLKFSRGIPGPHLILCPKSVLGNWAKEFKMWSPSLRIYRFHATSEVRHAMVRAVLNPNEMKYDVILTTYEMLNTEFSAFKKIEWRYLIVDEAHRLKSEDSLTSNSARKLHASYRLLITGTPLQNNLRELWALLNFLIPDLFTDAEAFDRWFNVAEGKEDGGVVGRMYKLLSPLMLRRLKSDVNTSIPPKKEIYVECPLSATQREQYTSILAKDSDVLNKGTGQRSVLMNIFMQLRKTCNHPYLFPGVEDGPPFITSEKLITASGKLHLLDRILRHLYERREEQHKVLIFSQMTRVLDILEDYCNYRSYRFGRIDGNTSSLDRDKQMADFNAPNSDLFIFLLSTRAGGLGINLQAANYVVIYDSDWNPQSDLQAQDRAHRMGQKRPVTVLRMITQGTVEERIYTRALKKLYLDAVVVQQGRLQQKEDMLSNQELLGMIKFGVEAMFRNKGETSITDEDIEALLHRGEDTAKAKHAEVLQRQQITLANFQLGIDETNIYEFEGVNYHEETPSRTLFISGLDETVTDAHVREACETIAIGDVTNVTLNPNRTSVLVQFRSMDAAKRVRSALQRIGSCTALSFSYATQKVLIAAQDLVEHLEPQFGRGKRFQLRGLDERLSDSVDGPSATPAIKLPKMPKRFDAPRWQLFDVPRIHELQEKEKSVLIARARNPDARAQGEENAVKTGGSEISEGVDASRVDAVPPADASASSPLLPPQEAKEKERLLAEGFSHWTHSDYQTVIMALAMYGRHATDKVIAAFQGRRTPEEVSQYLKALWRRGPACLGERTWGTIMKRIEKGEQLLQRKEKTRSLIAWKVIQLFPAFSARGVIAPTMKGTAPLSGTSDATRGGGAVVADKEGEWRKRLQLSTLSLCIGNPATFEQQMDKLTLLYAHDILERFVAADRSLPDLAPLSEYVLRMVQTQSRQLRFDVYTRTLTAEDTSTRLRRLLRDIEKEQASPKSGRASPTDRKRTRKSTGDDASSPSPTAEDVGRDPKEGDSNKKQKREVEVEVEVLSDSFASPASP